MTEKNVTFFVIFGEKMILTVIIADKNWLQFISIWVNTPGWTGLWAMSRYSDSYFEYIFEQVFSQIFFRKLEIFIFNFARKLGYWYTIKLDIIPRLLNYQNIEIEHVFLALRVVKVSIKFTPSSHSTDLLNGFSKWYFQCALWLVRFSSAQLDWLRAISIECQLKNPPLSHDF